MGLGLVIPSIIFFEILSFFIVFYLYVIFIHPKEKPIGSKLIYKIVILFSYSIIFQPFIFLPLDFLEKKFQSGINYYLFWEIIFYSFISLYFLVIPFFLFFYNKNKEMNFCYNLFFVILDIFIYVSIFLILLSIFYAALGFSSVNQNTRVFYLDFLKSFFIFFGNILLAIFFSAGLVYFPFKNFQIFFQRPKYMDKLKKVNQISNLKTILKYLKKEGEELKDLNTDITQTNRFRFFKRQIKKIEYKKRFSNFKKEIFIFQKNYQNFKTQIKPSNHSTIKPYLNLIIAIFSFFLNLLIILDFLLIAINYKNIKTILQSILIFFYYNIGGILFLILLTFFFIYLDLLIIYGYFYLSLDFLPFFSIYPLGVHSTFVNGFLWNLKILILCNFSFIVFFSKLLYGLNDELFFEKNFGKALDNKFYGWAKECNFFEYFIFVGVWVLLFLIIVRNCCGVFWGKCFKKKKVIYDQPVGVEMVVLKKLQEKLV